MKEAWMITCNRQPTFCLCETKEFAQKTAKTLNNNYFVIHGEYPYHIAPVLVSDSIVILGNKKGD